ncbi:MAG: UDP-4-amino-4,6-dideoxy-N-acetyl-beta-L-altrosamine transaminase [bacterium]|nr:UDP-4-amino-4,6-dideoxy-N-acetyl-beta-L-altrosamine transaminase [bacterium]
MISYGRQDITAADKEAVIEVLNSDFLTQGPAIPAFEKAVAEQVKVGHGVAFCNATAALHGAYNALGIGPKSLVWTSPLTFVATANAARMLGADVDFIDTDPRTYNLSIEALEKKLEQAGKKGRLPDLVVPVHLTGQSCDMEAIKRLGEKFGFRIVEDASHAIGGGYKDHPVGSCRHSDITIFSFHPVKIITTGEGGMAMTNDGELAFSMQLFRSHGITRDIERMEGEPDGGWYYEMLSLGFNYRMTDIQAALGASQLTRLDGYVKKRHEIAAYYDKKLADQPIILPHRESWQYSGFHLYVIGWPDGTGGRNRKQAFTDLREAGIGVNVHYMPVHLQPYYAKLGFAAGDFPSAEDYYAKAITLPLYPNLSDEELGKVVSTVKRLAAC